MLWSSVCSLRYIARHLQQSRPDGAGGRRGVPSLPSLPQCRCCPALEAARTEALETGAWIMVRFSEIASVWGSAKRTSRLRGRDVRVLNKTSNVDARAESESFPKCPVSAILAPCLHIQAGTPTTAPRPRLSAPAPPNFHRPLFEEPELAASTSAERQTAFIATRHKAAEPFARRMA